MTVVDPQMNDEDHHCNAIESSNSSHQEPHNSTLPTNSNLNISKSATPSMKGSWITDETVNQTKTKSPILGKKISFQFFKNGKDQNCSTFKENGTLSSSNKKHTITQPSESTQDKTLSTSDNQDKVQSSDASSLYSLSSFTSDPHQQHPAYNWQDVVEKVLCKNYSEKLLKETSLPSSKLSFDSVLLRETLRLPKGSNVFPLDQLQGFIPSITVFLYKNAFICRNLSSAKPNGNAQPYTRSCRNFLRSIDMGLIPYDLANQAPCIFYDGKIIVELHDYRDATTQFPRSSSLIGKGDEEMPSSIRKVLLHPTADMMAQKIEELVKTERGLDGDLYPPHLLVEQKILDCIYSPNSLCLDPSVDVVKVASTLYYNGKQTRNRRACETFRYRRFEKIPMDTSTITNKVSTSLNKRKRSLPTSKPIVKKQTTSPSNSTKSSEPTQPTQSTPIETKNDSEKIDFMLDLEVFDIGLQQQQQHQQQHRQQQQQHHHHHHHQQQQQPSLKDSVIPSLTLVRQDSDFDFLGNLLGDSENHEIPLPSSSTTEEMGGLTLQQEPFEITKPSSQPLSEQWFAAAAILQEKLKEAALANVNHIRNVQPLPDDGVNRIGSIQNLSHSLGKARWPSEVIALARARREQALSPDARMQPSPFRGPALAIMQAMTVETEKAPQSLL